MPARSNAARNSRSGTSNRRSVPLSSGSVLHRKGTLLGADLHNPPPRIRRVSTNAPSAGNGGLAPIAPYPVRRYGHGDNVPNRIPAGTRSLSPGNASRNGRTGRRHRTIWAGDVPPSRLFPEPGKRPFAPPNSDASKPVYAYLTLVLKNRRRGDAAL